MTQLQAEQMAEMMGCAVNEKLQRIEVARREADIRRLQQEVEDIKATMIPCSSPSKVNTTAVLSSAIVTILVILMVLASMDITDRINKSLYEQLWGNVEYIG